jgi:hypothetical protein
MSIVRQQEWMMYPAVLKREQAAFEKYENTNVKKLTVIPIVSDTITVTNACL